MMAGDSKKKFSFVHIAKPITMMHNQASYEKQIGTPACRTKQKFPPVWWYIGWQRVATDVKV